MTSVVAWVSSALMLVGLVFANVEVGSVVPRVTLKGTDEVACSLVDAQRVTAFLFFDPEQEHSREVLQALGRLQKGMSEPGVRWIGIVSDRVPEDVTAEVVDSAGVDLSIVVDRGDALYGALGVRLFPSIGIVDTEGLLRAYLPFAKVNYMGSVEAHLRHVLGQINDEELQQALHPKSIDVHSQEAAIGRTLKFARMLWDAGKRDKALAKAQEAEENAPDLAGPHALVGFFMVEEGNCDDGRTHLDAALAIEPDHEGALAALSTCNQ